MANPLYDGFHVVEWGSPYFGWEIQQVETWILEELRGLCAERLAQARSGEGICHTREEYRGEPWGYVREVDPRHWEWYIGEVQKNLQVYDDVLRGRQQKEQERRRQEQLTLDQAAAAEPLFTEEEQLRIAREQVLDRMEAHWRTGFGRDALTQHTDHGGSHDGMLLLNFEKEIARKLFRALRSELGEPGKTKGEK